MPKPPIAPIAAGIMFAMDAAWSAPELAASPTLVGLMPLSMMMFFACTLITAFIQHAIDKDSWSVSIAKGLGMGVIAGLPFFVGGTAAGAAILGWFGLYKLAGGDEQKQLDNPRVIDQPKR